MAKKKLKCDGIFFVGKSSEDVTGSQYLIKFGDTQILIECGLHQCASNDYLDSYKINKEKFKFDPSEIDYLFVAHTHIDHCGLIPRLVKCGFNGKIISTYETAKLMKPLLFNSCAIIAEEARILSKRYSRTYTPLYEEADVKRSIGLIESYEKYNYIYKLSDTVSFQWLHNAHCVGAAQLQLILSYNNKTKRILYTSDLGALNTKNHYVENTEIPTMFNDVVIMESTYGDSKRTSKTSRNYDIKHLNTAIDTVLGRGGTAVLPCFSFSRTQELLTTLYDIYSGKQFNYPVIVDSKLSCDICKLYDEILVGEDKAKWETVKNWENLHLISEKEESMCWVNNQSPKIILSSSGFCTNGRVISYLRRYLKDSRSMVIFAGYAGDNPSYLSYRIKNYRQHKYISINKEKIPNKADCITLSTFSSHANHNDLIEFGSSLNTNKLVLVHGSEEAKKCLSDDLKKAISEKDKTFRVVCSCRNMTINL